MSAQEELDLATVTADLEAALERARRLLRSRDERRSGVLATSVQCRLKQRVTVSLVVEARLVADDARRI